MPQGQQEIAQTTEQSKMIQVHAVRQAADDIEAVPVQELRRLFQPDAPQRHSAEDQAKRSEVELHLVDRVQDDAQHNHRAASGVTEAVGLDQLGIEDSNPCQQQADCQAVSVCRHGQVELLSEVGDA